MLAIMSSPWSGRDKSVRFGRFLLVGAVNAAAGYCIFLSLYWLAGLDYLLANILTFLLWSYAGFELQRRWVFRSEGGIFVFGKYLPTHLASLGIGSGLLYVSVEFLALSPGFAYILVVGATAVFIYTLSVSIIFKPRRTSQSLPH